MAVQMKSQREVNRIVSHEEGVIASVRVEARRIFSKAEARLAANRYEGQSSVSLTYGDTDAFVNLDDPAALSIEFSRIHNFSHERIEGLHIITGAAGLY